MGGCIDGAKQVPWWAVCLLLAVLGVPVSAEVSQPKIIISPLVRAEVSTVLDFSLRVDSANPPPVGSFIVITGLPASVTFSAGRATGTGVWEVPLAALDGLKMVAGGEPSRSALILFLATKKKDLVILDSALSFLVIEAPIQEVRRQAAAKKIEDERLAEVRRAEDAKKAEEAKAEDARRQAAAKKVEDERLAEARRAEDAKKAEEVKAEDARRQAAAKKVEDERLAEVRRAEDAKKAEEAKADDVRRQAAAKKVEDERLAEARRAEDAKKAEEDVQRQAAAKKVEDERLAEVRRAEDAKKAEEAKAEGVRRQAAAKKVEDERLAEVRRAEDAKKAEEAKAEDAQRQAAAKKVEDERVAEVRRAEDAKKAEEAKAEAVRRQVGVARIEEPTGAITDLRVASQRLIIRGDEQVDLGNIVLARQYFLRAAQAGLAAAAFKLAETHDPHELARLKVHGPMPDLTEAKRWYRARAILGPPKRKPGSPVWAIESVYAAAFCGA